MKGWLVVFAKEPVPGRVKTRLTPPFSAEEAAALYGCLLEDVLETSARAAQQLGLEAVAAVDPPAALASLAARAVRGLRAVVQRGPGLAGRMEHVVAEAAAAGAGLILLRGSDSPTLDVEDLAAALEALEKADLVLRPDRDGGYNLVGLHEPVPGLFDHPMSTPHVLEDTLTNAAGLGLVARLLPPGFDIDTQQDLRWLADARRGNPSLPCPRTIRLLDERELWPR